MKWIEPVQHRMKTVIYSEYMKAGNF